MDRETIFRCAAGAALALGVAWFGSRVRNRALRRKWRREQVADWTALAQPRGFEVDDSGDKVVMRGKVASRPFELDGFNCITYGMDAETGIRFEVEDQEATFAVTTWDAQSWRGGRQPPCGDEAFDARHQVRANDRGLRHVARLGPEERKLFVDFPELDVLQSHGSALIRLPYRLDGPHLDAACSLIERLWGPASSEA
jgi:hypothetical protein